MMDPYEQALRSLSDFQGRGGVVPSNLRGLEVGFREADISRF